MTDGTEPTAESIIAELHQDRRLAHAVLFAHRHKEASAPFHATLIDRWHSSAPRSLFMLFRGAAKSTLGEEAITLRGLFREFRNCLIIGDSEERAVDRLRSIKRELTSNDELLALFGGQEGDIWQETKIVLPSGVMIQALGQGQSLRGVKHIDARPDFCFVDDLESAESVATPAARRKLAAWFYSDLLPSLDPKAMVRMAATPLDPRALAESLMAAPDWQTLRVPIMTIDERGEEQSAWPERFPMEMVREIKERYERDGQANAFAQEYMCQPVDPATRTFTRDMLRVEPIVRTWHAVYAAYDPARTSGPKSATTGRAIGSWVGRRLVVWEMTAQRWRPDEIVDDLFTVDSAYAPVAIGVEKDGIDDFLLQPIRHESLKRQHLLPVRALKAPHDKDGFIGSLQPFFIAREVVFAGADPAAFAEAFAQLLAFPTGLKDAPNALAYLLLMRPGLPVYETFSHAAITQDAPLSFRGDLFLAVNATATETSAALVEMGRQTITVVADWIEPGGPGDALASIARRAAMVAGKPFTPVAPREHFDRDTLGMRAAATRATLGLRRGGLLPDGRDAIKAALERQVRDRPAFQVAASATWTLRAMAGGHCDGPASIYTTLMGGIESLLGMSALRGSEGPVRYDWTNDGRRFITTRTS